MADKAPEKAIVAALIRAKAKFKPLEKGKVNPFFKSKYADLHNVYESVDDALASEGLVLIQPLVIEAGVQYLHSRLMHVSGEEIESKVKVPDAPDQQKFGASVTYLKRTAGQALLAIASQDEDDDGEEAVGRGDQRPVARVAEKPTRIITKPAPAIEKNTTMPNVLGIVKSVDKKVQKVSPYRHFVDLIVKPDGASEERVILLMEPENKAQEDAVNMLVKDLEAAMMGKQYVEVAYTISGVSDKNPDGNKMYAGSKIHPKGEEPKL